MDVVIKISNDYTADTTDAQFIDPADLTFTDELVNTGSMSFSLSLSDLQIGSIYELRKVALFAIEEGQDKYLWSGIIDEIENDLGYAIIRCGDEKDWLRRKMNFTGYDWTSVDLQTALTTLLAEVNGRRGPNEGLLTLSTSQGALIINKQFDIGTSVFDIISQICQKLNLEWKVVFNQIIIEPIIGTDRTVAGDDYRQFIWNRESPNENKITKFKNLRSSKEIATHVIGKGSGGSATVIGDKTIFGSVEKSVSMDNGDISVQTQEYVDKHEVSQIERDMEVIVDEEDARILMVGDKIAVKIIHGSALADTDEGLKIIQRQFLFENKKPTVSVKVSKIAKQVESPDNYLADLNRRVKRLELY